SQNYMSLFGKVDWVTKHAIIQRKQQRGAQVTSSQLEQLDLDYHDIVNGVVYSALTKQNLVTALAPSQEVQKAMNTPPKHTRAVLRAEFIQQVCKTGLRYSCDWTQCVLHSPQHIEVTILNPFEDKPSDDYLHMMKIIDSCIES
ncbi:MAG: proteasome accessory factor PafA2 family protein, partial [Bifidobacteriaceae bacterium]|nr:proteasome accessory factor PafA2 family protein [Bifidobacteriaceae bacterium]